MRIKYSHRKLHTLILHAITCIACSSTSWCLRDFKSSSGSFVGFFCGTHPDGDRAFLFEQLMALMVVRRIVSWQILRMDKCVCVVHLFYMRIHAWFDAMHVFAFAYACHMHVPFKLWVICTVAT